MKVELIGKNLEKGGSAIEILIALTIFSLSASAIIMMTFGSESVILGAEKELSSLSSAKNILENARAIAKENFNAVNSTDKLLTNDLTPCKKLTRATEDKSELITILTDIKTFLAYGNDCYDEEPKGAWNALEIIGSLNIESDIEITHLDVKSKIIYVAAKSPILSKSDLFIINASDPENPTLVSSLDTGPGLNAIDVAGNIAYATSDNATNQLQIIDIGDIYNPSLIAYRSLPGVLESGSYPQGRSVFYYNKKIFIGTKETAGPEFHVFDVSDPLSPTWLGSKEITNNINAISARNDLAYLATSGNAREVLILNTVIFPMTQIGTFDAPGNEDGTTINMLGNKVYLGRKRSASNPDFIIIDIQNPALPIFLGSKNLGLKYSNEVKKVLTSGDFTFLAANDEKEFYACNIKNPENIPDCAILNSADKLSSLDYEDNLIYASTLNNDAIQIIKSNQ